MTYEGEVRPCQGGIVSGCFAEFPRADDRGREWKEYEVTTTKSLMPGVDDFEYNNNVCTDHAEGYKSYWEVENLLKAHLVAPCAKCAHAFKNRYPNGINTCTCRNLLVLWQCRPCSERSVRFLQKNFRRRVLIRSGKADPDSRDPEKDPDMNPGGVLDRRVISWSGYHRLWEDIREQLIREHPCHHTCGNQRLKNKSAVMDCRACGGIIIEPTASTRHRVGEAIQLDDGGRPVTAGRDGGEDAAGIAQAAAPLVPIPTEADNSNNNDEQKYNERIDDEDGVDGFENLRDDYDEAHEGNYYNDDMPFKADESGREDNFFTQGMRYRKKEGARNEWHWCPVNLGEEAHARERMLEVQDDQKKKAEQKKRDRKRKKTEAFGKKRKSDWSRKKRS